MRLFSIMFLALSLGSAACNRTTGVTIPAGTALAVVLDTTIGSDTSHAEQGVEGHLSRAVAIDGAAVLPEGTRVHGVVTDATPSGKVKGRASVGVRFTSVIPAGSGEGYQIQPEPVERLAAATKAKDALEIGGGAGGGAIIGALFGGKKGAAIGAAVGGGAGTAVVLSTSGNEVHLARGVPLALRLTAPVTIKVRG